MALGRKFRRTTFIAAIRFISTRASSLAYIMLMSRWLSKNEMGIVASLSIGVLIIPKMVIDWLGWVMQQKALTATDNAVSKGIISDLSYNILIFGFVFCPVLTILYLLLMKIPFPSTLGILFLLIVALEVFVQLFLNVEAAKINLEFRVFALLLQALLNYSLAIALYYIFKSIEFILIAWAFTEALLFIILFNRNVNVFYNHDKKLELLSVIKFGIPVFFLFLFRNLSTTIDRIVIGAVIDQEVLATYHLAYRIVDVFAKGILTMMIALFPIIMKLESLNTKKSELVFLSTFKVITLLILSIFPFLSMFAPYVITIIVSMKYEAGAPLLSVLSIAAALDIISNISIQFKWAKGETKTILNYTIWYFFSQITFSLILIRFGAMGIAFSRVVGSIVSFSYIISSTSWIRTLPRRFFGKVIFLTISMFLMLWLLNQFLHLLLALSISIVIILFESSVIRYFTKAELNTIESGIPSEVQPLFLLYRQLETIFANGEPKKD